MLLSGGLFTGLFVAAMKVTEEAEESKEAKEPAEAEEPSEEPQGEPVKAKS